jgi:hypothetical protein
MKVLESKWRIIFGMFLAGLFFLSFTSLSNAGENHSKEAQVFMTAESNTNRLADLGFRAFEPLEQPDECYPTIIVDTNKTFQVIEGFGGTFTDATAINFGKMSREKREEFLTACFDPERLFQVWVSGEVVKYSAPAKAIITMVF